ncbi:hypothetical protein [uncultured Desulfovibrio sp.]|uniref:hypothetical protein n=1 Tax=uncultured Desulfovibrio sp. TaxID=167968 RepID=UPI0026345D69|nr:hypothetical protein [uncultured Desulfovibrio sp.]
MRRLLPLVLLCAAAVIPMAAPSAAVSAHVPPPATGLYAGGERAGRGERRVELYLLDGNFFVLRQISVPRGGEPVTRDVTGLWRRTGDGALLRLSNRHGLSLRLNVGGGGNLYGDFFPAPGGTAQGLVLKKSPFRPLSFRLMGRLDRAGGRAALTDSATGRVFAPLAGEALAALPGEDPLLVDAEILPGKNGTRVRRVWSFSGRFPSWASAAPSAGDFSAAAGGAVWLLPSLPGLPAASCVFSGNAKGGALEVTGPGLRLSADYTLRGTGLTFSLGDADAGMLRACGAEALARMLASVRSWSLEDGALVLDAADGQSFALERAAPRGPMPGRAR